MKRAVGVWLVVGSALIVGLAWSGQSHAQTFHSACVDKVCQKVSGTGVDACTTNADCVGPLPTHKGCYNNTCRDVLGEGGDQCYSDQDCQTAPVTQKSFVIRPVTQEVFPNQIVPFRSFYNSDAANNNTWQEVTAQTSWGASDRSIADVVQGGSFRAKRVGQTVIAASYYSLNATALLVVRSRPQLKVQAGSVPNTPVGSPMLTLEPTSGSVPVGDNFSFRLWYDPDGSGPAAQTDVTKDADWISSDPLGGAFLKSGEFQGKAPGRVAVTVAYNPQGVKNIYDLDNLSVGADVTVTGPTTSVAPITLTGPATSSEAVTGGKGGGNMILGIGLIFVVLATGGAVFFFWRKLF